MVLKGDAILKDVFLDGSSVSVRCNPGYVSAGPSSIKCTGGTWSDLRITCTSEYKDVIFSIVAIFQKTLQFGYGNLCDISKCEMCVSLLIISSDKCDRKSKL